MKVKLQQKQKTIMQKPQPGKIATTKKTASGNLLFQIQGNVKVARRRAKIHTRSQVLSLFPTPSFLSLSLSLSLSLPLPHAPLLLSAKIKKNLLLLLLLLPPPPPPISLSFPNPTFTNPGCVGHRSITLHLIDVLFDST